MERRQSRIPRMRTASGSRISKPVNPSMLPVRKTSMEGYVDLIDRYMDNDSKMQQQEAMIKDKQWKEGQEQLAKLEKDKKVLLQREETLTQLLDAMRECINATVEKVRRKKSDVDTEVDEHQKAVEKLKKEVREEYSEKLESIKDELDRLVRDCGVVDPESCLEKLQRLRGDNSALSEQVERKRTALKLELENFKKRLELEAVQNPEEQVKLDEALNSVEEKKVRLRRLERDLAHSQDQIDAEKRGIKSIVGKLAGLESYRGSLELKRENLKTQRDELRSKVAELEGSLRPADYEETHKRYLDAKQRYDGEYYRTLQVKNELEIRKGGLRIYDISDPEWRPMLNVYLEGMLRGECYDVVVADCNADLLQSIAGHLEKAARQRRYNGKNYKIDVEDGDQIIRVNGAMARFHRSREEAAADCSFVVDVTDSVDTNGGRAFGAVGNV